MNPIRIVPRIDALEIHEAGPIRHLRLAFVAGMNILTDRGGGGTGKTTVLNCAAAAATAYWPVEHQSSVRSRTKVIAESGGSIYMFEPSRRAMAPGPQNPDSDRSSFPFAGRALGSLRRTLISTPAHSLVLMDAEILGVMDLCRLRRAIQLLAASPAQKLIVVAESLVGCFIGFPCRLFTLELRNETAECTPADL